MTTHDGAFLPWGSTVIGQRVTDGRFQDDHGWVCLLHQTQEAETRLWVAARVHVDDVDSGPPWRDVLVTADTGPAWAQPDTGRHANPEDVVQTTGASWFANQYTPWARPLPDCPTAGTADGPLPPRWVCPA